jgi:prephenate dehydratase
MNTLMKYIDRRKFLNRTGAALAIGAVSTQSAAATSGGDAGQQTVGTLGPAGSYSHRAALQASDDIEFYDTMFEVAAAVTNENIDAGVLPIENSIQGAVIDTLDILIEEDLFITAEATEEIRHALIGQSDDFEVIASHSQALSQSSSFLEDEYPGVEQQEVDSTSAGVEMAAEDETVAAVAHPDLADDFDLEAIATDIQDVENNVTRFLKFERSREEDGGSKSTVLVYPGSDAPGLPSEVLRVLATTDLDLTRLEARPSATKLGDYIYHLDFEHEQTEQIVCRLETVTEWTRYLGSYDLITE